MLEIENLHVSVEGQKILNGLSLTVPTGEVHAIMGPNGSGKSTLSYVVSGRDGYCVEDGSIKLDGKDLAELDPEERAASGLFLSFQHPLEIPGVGTMNFVRTSLNAQRKSRDEEEMSAGDFLKLFRAKSSLVGLSADKVKRPFNVGFSGGEKKRMEMLQMSILEPRFAIMDETDSGLDIDALKMVGNVVNDLRAPDRGFLVITHYQRLLDHVKPDRIHVLAGGRIVQSGGPELAADLETNGYDKYVGEAA